MVVISSICIFSTTASALDSRVTASNVKLEFRTVNNSYKQARAVGYITATQKHSCTARVVDYWGNVLCSKKKIGTGKVTATTAYSETSSLSTSFFGGQVFYDFDL